MQIPTNFSAAQAVSISSQVSARDKDAAIQATSPTENTNAQATLEKSHGASADRDAQGQGDGMGEHSRKQQDENQVIAGDETPSADTIMPITAADEDPPTLIDMVC